MYTPKSQISIFVFLFFSFLNLKSQSSIKDLAVTVHALVNESPTEITIKWENTNFISSTDIFKKLKSQKNFSNKPIASINAPIDFYNDSSVEPGIQYDYLIRQRTTFTVNGNNFSFAWGGISAGINVELVEYKGKVLVVVDTLIQNNLKDKVQRFADDLIEDGWVVSFVDKTIDDSVSSIKKKISSWYNTDKENAKSVILMGDIPVPYSGNFGESGDAYPPDGHVPDHNGAWPADVYYGVMNETLFTDRITNDQGTREANKNRPGDGKFDQSRIPGDVILQIGRIDMSRLNAVGLNYIGRTERYLDKNHAYRNKNFVVPERYLFEDRLGIFNLEAPGRLHYFQRALFEEDSLIHTSNDFFARLNREGFLWSGVTSTAGYTGISGIGDVNKFSDSTFTVFSNYFGSYFGDWDNENNFLRGSIAGPGYTLTSIWDGRPLYHFYHMALGENIGYSLRHNQQNQALGTNIGYFVGYDQFQRGIYMSLMGDPSLRLHTLYPISDLSATSISDNKKVQLSWSASLEMDLEGYAIFRAATPDGPYFKIVEAYINDTSYIDETPFLGDNYYMVRTVQHKHTPSGSYFNMSQGRRAFVSDIEGPDSPSSVRDLEWLNSVVIYPNPSKSILNIETIQFVSEVKAELIDVNGSRITNFNITDENQAVNLENLPSGVYYVKFTSGSVTKTLKWVKI